MSDPPRIRAGRATIFACARSRFDLNGKPVELRRGRSLRKIAATRIDHLEGKTFPGPPEPSQKKISLPGSQEAIKKGRLR